jgi:uncharacterized protein DUF2252
MNIRQATKAYELWLGSQLPLLPADLKLKHQRMAQSAFPFLRATFYRWVQLWPQECPELAAAPAVLGVGDLHLENFGTWRDREGRLVWGVNDFDETCQLSYANDLVRLAVSAQLAAKENQLSCDPGAVCNAILTGYEAALEQGGLPFVLAEHHGELRDLAMNELRDPVRYWARLSQCQKVDRSVPPELKAALRQALPEPGLAFRVVHRQAGLGSLGRRRFTALAEWRGGLVAREAKELACSAWHWEKPGPPGNNLLYQRVIERAVRVPDPFVGCSGRWLIRRLAPDCSRIELSSLPNVKDELKLLEAMGNETANIHLGSPRAAGKVLSDLRKRPGKWLLKASAAMMKETVADWDEWRGK